MPLEPGDAVCLCDTKGRVVGLRVPEPDDVVRVPGLGVVPGGPLIETGYGGRMVLGSRELSVLRPTPALIASAVHHATQVVRAKDTGRILAETGIGAGSIVVEGGTGSGALTCALALAVGDGGRVHGHEPSDKNREVTRASLATFGLADRVELHGARLEDCTVTGADAFVADVPDPASVVPAAAEALAPGGSLAIYAPQVTQARDAAVAAREHDFMQVKALEVIERAWVVDENRARPDHDMLGHTAFLVFGVRGA